MVLAIHVKVKIITLEFPPPKKKEDETKPIINKSNKLTNQTNKHTTNPTPKTPKLQA